MRCLTINTNLIIINCREISLNMILYWAAFHIDNLIIYVFVFVDYHIFHQHSQRVLHCLCLRPPTQGHLHLVSRILSRRQPLPPPLPTSQDNINYSIPPYNSLFILEKSSNWFMWLSSISTMTISVMFTFSMVNAVCFIIMVTCGICHNNIPSKILPTPIVFLKKIISLHFNFPSNFNFFQNTTFQKTISRHFYSFPGFPRNSMLPTWCFKSFTYFTFRIIFIFWMKALCPWTCQISFPK